MDQKTPTARSAFCFVPILCPFRAQAVPSAICGVSEMTFGRRARAKGTASAWIALLWAEPSFPAP